MGARLGFLLALAVHPVLAGGVAAPAVPGKTVPAVKVDTVGYPNDWAKTGVLNFMPVAVTVVDEQGQTVLRLPASAVTPLGLDAASKDEVWRADFSALTATGRYRLAFDGAKRGQSDPFDIGPGVYSRALMAAQKMFYYQRTRCALTEPYTLWDEGDDDYTRLSPSHTYGDVGWLLDDYPAKQHKWTLAKGWFDAGNYDMYVASTAPTVCTLLMAFELQPAAFGDSNGIPESGNGVPDILDEATWGLDWMLSLQAPEGAFRAREAVMRLGEVPEGTASKDKTTRWISAVASASTAKACAAFATAARIYRPFDGKRAGAYARAAQRAWAWLKAHPQRLTLSVPGSDQPLWDDGAEYPSEAGARAAAAFAMWRSFRLQDALADLRARWADPQLSAERLEGGWPNVGRFAVLGAALDLDGPNDLRAQGRQRLMDHVAPLQKRVEADGYRCALKPDEYYWGSPSVLMQKAFFLALAARLDPSGHAWAREAARDQWHWVLGRNPNACSLVSRVGKGPTRIYHTEWGKKKSPPPGFLIDGPNFSNAAFLSPDAPAKALLWYSPKDLASGVKAGDPFHNDQNDLWEGGFVPKDSWSTGWWVVTEVDILYNADLVLAGALIAP